MKINAKIDLLINHDKTKMEDFNIQKSATVHKTISFGNSVSIKGINIFVDDERYPETATPKYKNSDFIIVRTSQDCFDLFKKHKHFIKFITFDHDLGEKSEKDGYELVKQLIGYDMDVESVFSKDFKFSVHSANPVGKNNIIMLLKNYMREKYSVNAFDDKILTRKI